MHLRQLFLENMAQTSDFPLALEFTKAEGVYLIDKSGKKYIDLIAGIAVSNVGHRHPKVVQAIKDQADQYLHQMVYGEYVQSPQVMLAKALADTLAAYKTNSGLSINNAYFTNSGTEAVEGAMKLAKRYTGRTEIIAFHNAYHGSTQGALSLGDEEFKRNFRPTLPDIRKIARENFEDLNLITERTAAVFYEPVGGESGVRPASQAYITALGKRCKETGTLLVFDEIQNGFGRTGSFWAFEQYGVVPDILLAAKGMGGGMPIGAFMAPREIMSVLTDNPILGHITTFGGHPVSCAASLATVSIIHDEIDHSETLRKGELFKSLLVHPKIKEVRGMGLMLAVQLSDFEYMKAVIDRTIENGVITDWFLYCDNAMRIAPPLTITDEQIHVACEVILGALGS
ncbi:aspartate aminotransferase family protein [Arcticibacterium luteifluviistationis]|uniref:Aspartate aminotransferase family protein n=1 Tax=Arcticibacterium luteifluviistationis TaxID=1784714 RepID=A0A2Z4G785_9BACT|nr:aminotransferase class III-fold pyridoxal phosphate-dependent enzyme [Arcticibacterium luteifluviistationis]AWV97034.1 aspartate aminotransferase family protein [Arcticibacterium luteifluviistationis]